MIDSSLVRDALRPRFGSALVNLPDFPDPLVSLLQEYDGSSPSFHDLAVRLEEALFSSLYERLGSGMSVVLDRGAVRRIRMAEIPDAADDVLGVLFDSLNVCPASFDSLRAYSLDYGSLAAMRTLYCRYEGLMPPEERDVLARVIRGFPPERWQSWMKCC